MAGAMHLPMHGELGKPVERCEHAPRIGAGARQAYAVRNVRQFDNHHRNALVAPQSSSDLPPSSRTSLKLVKSVNHQENDGHEEEQIQRGTDHRVP